MQSEGSRCSSERHRMSLLQLFILSACCWIPAARYIWSDVPKILLEFVEINEGEILDLNCTVPIDYSGGDCRLFRGDSDYPFITVKAQSYRCHFRLGSKQLLGHRPVGTKISIRCDYKLQDYISPSSYSHNIIVWGTRPSPRLLVRSHFLPLDDSIAATCSPPVAPVSRCYFYKHGLQLGGESCSRNLTGQELAVFQKPDPLLPVNLSCTYDPETKHYIRSDDSNHVPVFVVDMRKVSPSMDCQVSGPKYQLENSNLTITGANGATVTIRVTNSSLPSGHICRLKRNVNHF